MEVITFSSAIVTRVNDLIVIALFDGEPAATIALLQGDEDAARGLMSALAQALGSPPNNGTN